MVLAKKLKCNVLRQEKSYGDKS